MSGSSSSSCPELFNPDARLRRLVNLSVVKSDGTEVDIPEGQVVLQNGGNVAFELDEDRDETTISVSPGAGTEDPYLTQKFEALSNIQETNTADNPLTGPFEDPETGIIPEGDPWSFTTQSLWLGAINNTPADPGSGSFFIVGDRCMSVGEFENEEQGYPQDPRVCETVPTESSSVPQEVPCAAELALLDICIPCTDCLTWLRLEEYIGRISEFYDYILELTLDEETTTIPEHPDGGIREDFTGTYAQYIAAARYWDSLVHRSVLKLSAQGQGQSISVAGFYRNISDGEIGSAPDGVTFTYTLNFLRNGSNFNAFTANNTDVRALDRNGKTSAFLDSVSYLGSHTITVVMKSGLISPSTVGLSSGDEVYADFVLLIKDSDLFDDLTSEYTVDVDMSVTPTHIGTTVSRDTTVYFVPTESGST